MVLTSFNDTMRFFLKKQGIMAYNFLCAAENYEDAVFYRSRDNEISGAAMITSENRIFIYDEGQDFANEFFDKVLIPFNEYTFCGVRENILRLKERMAESWENPCDCYFSNLNNEVKEVDLKEISTKIGGDIRLSSLNLSNLEEVNYFYTYKDETSLDRIAEEITNRPSSAVIALGELAAWNVVHRDGSMGAMFTKEKYRKLGLAEVVTKDLIKKQKLSGKVPYVQIVADNIASKNLAAKCDLEYFGRVYWFGGIKK